MHADEPSHRIVVTSDTGATLWSGPMPPLEGSCGDEKEERPSDLESVHVDPSSDLVLIAYGWGFGQCGCPPGPVGHHVLHVAR